MTTIFIQSNTSFNSFSALAFASACSNFLNFSSSSFSCSFLASSNDLPDLANSDLIASVTAFINSSESNGMLSTISANLDLLSITKLSSLNVIY